MKSKTDGMHSFYMQNQSWKYSLLITIVPSSFEATKISANSRGAAKGPYQKLTMPAFPNGKIKMNEMMRIFDM